MTYQTNYNAPKEAVEEVLRNGIDGIEGIEKAIEILFNEAMKVERNRHLQATPYERTEERQGYANGYKDKTIKSRTGSLHLQVPQVRDGDFYPSVLEKGQRSERALKLAIAEMYVAGVSTRRVEKVMEEMCGFGISSTEVSRAASLLDEQLKVWRERPLGSYPYLFLDAKYAKVRSQGHVVDLAIFIAVGIDEKGKREVLGVSVRLSEQEVHWRDFLKDLQKRGLHGVKLITSDAHSGLKAAKQSVFPSVPWQRCQFHLQQNAQAYVEKRSMRERVGSDIRGIFNAPNFVEAERLLKGTVEKYVDEMPKLAKWMEENIPESLTVFSFPEKHWKRIRTSNTVERLNREIHRRIRTVSIFPHEASCERLVTAIVMEISEEWQSGQVYLEVHEEKEKM